MYPLLMEINGGIGEQFKEFLEVIKREMNNHELHECTMEIEFLKIQMSCVHRKSFISNALRRARVLMRSPQGYE